MQPQPSSMTRSQLSSMPLQTSAAGVQSPPVSSPLGPPSGSNASRPQPASNTPAHLIQWRSSPTPHSAAEYPFPYIPPRHGHAPACSRRSRGGVPENEADRQLVGRPGAHVLRVLVVRRLHDLGAAPGEV